MSRPHPISPRAGTDRGAVTGRVRTCGKRAMSVCVKEAGAGCLGGTTGEASMSSRGRSRTCGAVRAGDTARDRVGMSLVNVGVGELARGRAGGARTLSR